MRVARREKLGLGLIEFLFEQRCPAFRFVQRCP